MPGLSRSCCSAAVVLCIVIVGAVTGASDGETRLPAITVVTTRGERPVTQTPCSVDILDAEDLRLRRPVRTTPEAFGDEPGVMVQKTGHAQGSPFIRGLTGYRNLFLINGVRLNNSVFRDGPNQYWNTVDHLGLSRLELVRGPFSVLYGSDAIGGTVNAITRGAADLAPESSWDRRAYYRFSSAENSHIGRIESIGRLAPNMVFTFGYSLKEFGDLEGGSDVGTQEKTGYDELDWDAGLEIFPDEYTRVSVLHQDVDIDDAWRTHKTIYGIDWEGLTVGNELRRVLDQDRELTSFQYQNRKPGGFAESVTAGISYQSQSESRDRLRTESRHDVQGFEVDTAGAFLTVESPTSLGRLMYGAEYYHDDVTSFKRSLNPDGSIRSEAIQGPVADDATYDLLGVFLQDEIALSGRIAVFIGGRYEFAEAQADSVEDPATGSRMSVSDDWDDAVGSVRAMLWADDAKTVGMYAGASQGFRAPNLSDITRFDSARTDEIETPTTGLTAEHYVSWETGLKAKTARLNAQLAVYLTEIDGMIVRTPTGRVIDESFEVTKRNSGDGYIKGVELEAGYKLAGGFSLFGAGTWMYGEVETYPTADAVSVKEPVDRLMPPTGQLGLRWDSGIFWAQGTCTSAARADELSTRDEADTSRIPEGGTPGYTVFDVRLGCECSNNMALSLGIGNIFDEDYRIHGSGLNEPGRNLTLAADWRF